MNHDSIDKYIHLPFRNVACCDAVFSDCGGPLDDWSWSFRWGTDGGLMVVQDFKLRKKADIALEEDGTAPAAIVRQSVRQPFKRLVRG